MKRECLSHTTSGEFREKARGNWAHHHDLWNGGYWREGSNWETLRNLMVQTEDQKKAGKPSQTKFI